MNRRSRNLTKIQEFLTWFNLVWSVGVLILLLVVTVMLLTSCAAPYSAEGAPRPTKGKTLAAYQLGQSDAVKRQYWIARSLQMGKQKGEEVAYRTRFYTFAIQPDPAANINKVPYNITLPILE